MTPHLQQAVNFYQQGRLSDAERLLHSFLMREPRHADALQLAGLLCMQRGEAAKALVFWQRSLEVNPRQPAVYLNMSTAALNLQRPERALEWCETALSLQPGHVDALNNRGAALLALGRPKEALSSFEQALQHRPAMAVAHFNRGRALHRMKRDEEALAALDEAVRLQPADASIRMARGNLLMELLRPLDALGDYERLCAAAPRDPLAAFNRGLALEMANRGDAAVAAFDAALAHAPGFSQAHHHRGNALRALGRHAEAFESHSAAIALGNGYTEAWCGAGNALRELRRLAEALVHYERALALDPVHLEALSNRGRTLLALRRHADAVECYERLFKAAPEIAYRYNYALGHLLHARLCCCDWREYEPTVARISEFVLAGEPATLPSLLLVTGESVRAQLVCARSFVAANWALIRPARVPANGGHSKIRLAYVSADFRQHPVASLLASLIATHDRERFEIVGVSLRPPDSSPLGDRIRAAFDRFIDVHELADAQAVALLRQMQIDVAVDLNGYTDGFRAGLFAHRIAAVQVNFLGYAGTLGAPYMDYILADKILIRDDEQDSYDEKIALLPACFMPQDAERPPVCHIPGRLEAGLPERGFVFCCFNNHYKLNPRLFNIWMRMLEQVEGSILWLAGADELIKRNLRSEASQLGIVPERMVFAPRVTDHTAHVARYAAADLFLDTLPFNAHVTAAEALWAGLPVLTCRGHTMAGRVAASLVTAAGLPELVVDDLAEYESLGISLANSPGVLTSLRHKLLAGRATAALYDHSKFRRHLETAFTMMSDRACQGLAPHTFAVET